MDSCGNGNDGKDHTPTGQGIQVCGNFQNIDTLLPRNTHSWGQRFCPSNTGLLSLPVEVLASIFLLAHNLNLIYVCRHLWQSLASRYTKRLALAAFYNPGTAEADEYGQFPLPVPPILAHGDQRVLYRLKVHELWGCSPQVVREQLQADFFSCEWFTERHMQEIIRTLFRYSIEEMCNGQSLNITAEDWKGIDKFLDSNKGIRHLYEHKHHFRPIDRHGIPFEVEIKSYAVWVWRCYSNTLCEGLDKCKHCSAVTQPSCLDFAVPFESNVQHLIEAVGNRNHRACKVLDDLSYHPSAFGIKGSSRVLRPLEMFTKLAIPHKDQFYHYPTTYIYPPPGRIRHEVHSAIRHLLAQTHITYQYELSDPVGDECLCLLLELASYSCRRRYCFDNGRISGFKPQVNPRILSIFYHSAFESHNSAAFRRLTCFDPAWSRDGSSLNAASNLLKWFKLRLRKVLGDRLLQQRHGGRQPRRIPSLHKLLHEGATEETPGWIGLLEQLTQLVDFYQQTEADAKRKENAKRCPPISSRTRAKKRRNL